MAFRTRRENRYTKLRNVGFLRFEARPLSRVPTRICPYLREMMRERTAMLKRARTMGTSLRQFEEQIKELYRTNKWLKKNRVGKIVADPWRMFRDSEDKYKVKFPEYDSPWQKRWKDWRTFQGKIERTIRKQKGLA